MGKFFLMISRKSIDWTIAIRAFSLLQLVRDDAATSATLLVWKRQECVQEELKPGQIIN